jgi:hypothetical protein
MADHDLAPVARGVKGNRKESSVDQPTCAFEIIVAE